VPTEEDIMVSTPQEPSPLSDPDISTDDPLPPGGPEEGAPDDAPLTEERSVVD
jgi:hypothetical protein